MESITWPESLPSNKIKAIHELAQGRDLTNYLRDMLQCPRKTEYYPTYEDDVVVQIMAIMKNTISIMGSSTSKQNLPNIPISDLCSSYSSDGQKSENSDKSVGTIIPVKHEKGCYKRRKRSWTSSQVTSTLVDDGHAWRKYGQKHINNSQHQRSYYRCTYKLDQGCLAAKQVQMIQDKPPKYKTTYIGNHTCNNLQRAPQIILDSPSSEDSSILINFKTKELIPKRQVGAFTPSIKEDYFSQGNSRLDQFSYSSYYQPYNLINTCVLHKTLEPTHDNEITSGFYHRDVKSSVLHSGLDNNRDMITSRAYSSITSVHGYEMDHMLGMNYVNDFPSQFCFS